MKIREGDFIETGKGLILDVKGLVHPSDRVFAFPRYFPAEGGDRRRNSISYGKVYSLAERYDLLKQRYPQYLVQDAVLNETVCEVPAKDIRKIYRPAERLRELRLSKERDALEDLALMFAGIVKEKSKIRWNARGISGSLLVKLQAAGSDIDLICYGSDNCRKVHLALRMLIEESDQVKPYGELELKALFDFRSKDTAMSFSDFVRTESRKVMPGKFSGTDYFFRFVKNRSENREKYGDIIYRDLGTAEIEATIRDDLDSIFTPCTYQIECTKIVSEKNDRRRQPSQIASFRGRFCEQAKNGERVAARGKLESVTDKIRGTQYCRLLIGNSPSDFMILK